MSRRQAAVESRDAYAPVLHKAGYRDITTEIAPAGEFWYAEEYHQQYLHKVPWGYCPDHGTGVSCPWSPYRELRYPTGHLGLERTLCGRLDQP